MTGGQEEMTIIRIQGDMDVKDGITIRVYQEADSHRMCQVRHLTHRRGHKINFDNHHRIVQTVDMDIHLINSVLWRWARRATTVVSSIIFGVVADKSGEEDI